MFFMSIWQLANFFGDPPKYILTINSDSFPINYFFYVLKIIVEMLDNFSLTVISCLPVGTSSKDLV